MAEWQAEVAKVKAEQEQSELTGLIERVQERVSKNSLYNSGNLVLDVADHLNKLGLTKGIKPETLLKLEAPTALDQAGKFLDKLNPFRRNLPDPNEERLKDWVKKVKESVRIPNADRREKEIFRGVLLGNTNASYLGWGRFTRRKSKRL